MTRNKVVVGNWKMNPVSSDDAVTLARAIGRFDAGEVSVGVAPPYLALARVQQELQGTKVMIFAQDAHWENKGAFTSQVSAAMLKGVADGSIVGHSEVRRELGDSDDRVARKMVAVLRHALRVIVCVGETEDEYVAGETDAVLKRQIGVIGRALYEADETGEMSMRLTVAYEPVWAIGTGRAAAPEHAAAAIGRIRAELEDDAGLQADLVPILYGGSVSAANVEGFAKADGIDGALVGGASLKPEEFSAIVAAFQ